MAENKQGKKGRPRSTGSRRAKIAFYYEVTYPLRKLRRIWHDTGRIKDLRLWAEAYKCPSGMTATGILVRLSKELKLNLQMG